MQCRCSAARALEEPAAGRLSEDWEQRWRGGAVDAVLRARQDGVVAHVVCSSHMSGADIERVFEANVFEGVTLGYNAINFPYRVQAVCAAAARQLGVVAMNPLAGGVIPRHAGRFGFLRVEGEGSVVTGALRFIVEDPQITAALVGFADCDEVDSALAAVRGYLRTVRRGLLEPGCDELEHRDAARREQLRVSARLQLRCLWHRMQRRRRVFIRSVRKYVRRGRRRPSARRGAPYG